ncbi:hypothetical protein F5Y16DRAFT_64754 [Xylariaceae sp. FL0255]|nr:hypothetical protein F5Y16DRAFT_64754 [Xylariaceae sp. FL0255]
MSVPPQIIRVKRKAAEDAPVSYLRVQESKRHRSEVFVYQRQRKDQDAAFAESIPAEPQKPIIHTTVPSRQATAFQTTVNRNKQPSQSDNGEPQLLCDTANQTTQDSVPTSEPRRFHMSRKDIMLATHPYSRQGVSKKRSAPALFVERRIKRISSRTVEKLHAVSQGPGVGQEPTPLLAMEVDKPEPRKFKKPGVAKLAVAKDSSSSTNNKPELPKSMVDRWNVDLEQLTADMEAYAMEQIGLNIRKAEAEKEQQQQEYALRQQNYSSGTAPSKLKFKPKAPAKRWAERHPEKQVFVDEEMADAHATGANANVQTTEEMDAENSDSDGDYIIETYVRVPASSMGNHVSPQNVGVLVFDEEPDIEFFYGEGEDSEDEWAEDEEDENAENYYTADYPDEEVVSDDEFGQNPYSFRTGNASDLEEYDMIDQKSDHGFEDVDDDEGNTNQFRTYIGRNGRKSNHL